VHVGLRYVTPCERHIRTNSVALHHVELLFVCTVKRPPVEDILSFLESEDWIVQNMFGGLELAKVAHGLAGKYSVLSTHAVYKAQ